MSEFQQFLKDKIQAQTKTQQKEYYDNLLLDSLGQSISLTLEKLEKVILGELSDSNNPKLTVEIRVLAERTGYGYLRIKNSFPLLSEQYKDNGNDAVYLCSSRHPKNGLWIRFIEKMSKDYALKVEYGIGTDTFLVYP